MILKNSDTIVKMLLIYIGSCIRALSDNCTLD